MSDIVSINSRDALETEIENNDLVLVDFYADWCGPCKMMEPVLEDVNDELDEVTVLKVNVDENQDISTEYDVKGIPTLIIYHEESIVDRLVGAQSESDLINTLEEYIN